MLCPGVCIVDPEHTVLEDGAAELLLACLDLEAPVSWVQNEPVHLVLVEHQQDLAVCQEEEPIVAAAVVVGQVEVPEQELVPLEEDSPIHQEPLYLLLWQRFWSKHGNVEMNLPQTGVYTVTVMKYRVNLWWQTNSQSLLCVGLYPSRGQLTLLE